MSVDTLRNEIQRLGKIVLELDDEIQRLLLDNRPAKDLHRSREQRQLVKDKICELKRRLENEE